MNNEEYKKGIDLYEDLVEDYIASKLHHLIKNEKKINNIDYLIKRLRENVFDSYLNKFAYKAFNDICLNTIDNYGIYILMNCKEDCKLYKNLETQLEIIIPNNENDEFIKNNRIIVPKYIDSSYSFYNDLRNEFFRILTNNSETESISRILRKTKL